MWTSILTPEITVKQSKNLPKNAKKDNLLKTKRIVKTEIYAKWGPRFYIKLG